MPSTIILTSAGNDGVFDIEDISLESMSFTVAVEAGLR
jgi:hypothetical protein